MSYSRWSNSVWYTYYNVSSGDTLDEQRFTVEGCKTFTYKELLTDMLGCITQCDPDTLEEAKELRKYMEYFMADAEGRYDRE